MLDRTTLRWAGLLLAAGTGLFSLATLLGGPFEQPAVDALRAAIAADPARYAWANLLATAGLMIVVVGFGTLTLTTPVGRAPRPRRHLAGLGLLVAASAFWMLEVVFRLGGSRSSAGIPITGAGESSPLGAPPGAGLNAIFLAFLALTLAGMALLLWGLGDERVLPRREAHVGAGLVLASGVLAGWLYPWVGAVERALVYPLALVVLPAAMYLLLPRRRRLARRPVTRPFDVARG